MATGITGVPARAIKAVDRHMSGTERRFELSARPPRGWVSGIVHSYFAAAAGIAAVALLVAPLLPSTAQAATTGTPLVGMFTLTAGSCSGGVASGTYLRMVLSGGTNTAGPYFSNSDSTCSDNTYTPLAPGTAGGLITGTYQPQPSPAFDSAGNALANQITAPVAFEGVRFATATNQTDPQTGLKVPAPSIVANGSILSGNVQSFGVSWNNQEFNQGSPKPDGSAPANTKPVTGVYNSSTGAYTLQWSSQVVGGPFNGFSAYWNLTGRFIPSRAATSSASGTASNAGSTAVGGTPTASGTKAPATSPGTAGSGANTTTTIGSDSTSSPKVSKVTTRTVLSSRSYVSRTSGWRIPTWLTVVVLSLAVLGLIGVVTSDLALRRKRRNNVQESKGV